MSNFLKFEPLTRNAGLGAIAVAILNWIKVMGYLSWTSEQFAVTENTMLLVLSGLIFLISIIQPRFREVTPVKRPRDNDGNVLVPAISVEDDSKKPTE